jgi:hypothetical protein
MRRRKGFDQMSDEQVETMVREIIEQHLADAHARLPLIGWISALSPKKRFGNWGCCQRS